tara:strand:- start:825 stop:1082 length:258 start_codon:yes stop_codon:yes gene_type:complete
MLLYYIEMSEYLDWKELSEQKTKLITKKMDKYLDEIKTYIKTEGDWEDMFSYMNKIGMKIDEKSRILSDGRYLSFIYDEYLKTIA